VKVLYGKHAAKLQYLFVGVWNTLFGYGAFVALYYATAGLNIHYEVLLVLSQIISVTNAYILYKTLVFKTKGNVVREYVRFCTFYWLSFIANLLLLPVLVEGLHQGPMMSQGILTLGTAAMSYLWHAHYTFGFASKAGLR
jgi:putative flippase GtrA